LYLILFLGINYIGSRDSAVGNATSYELDDRVVGVRVPMSQFSFFHDIQTGSGAHPVSYLMSTGNFFPGVKRPGYEADCSTPIIPEFKKN
jgi:hypothetical protein